MTGIFSRAADWIYPKRCPVCDEIRKRKEPALCPYCRSELQLIREPRCKRCGKPVEHTQEYCMDCQKKSHEYEQGFAAFVYHRGMQASMLRFKEQGRREYAVFYSKMMLAAGGTLLRQWNCKILVPVPVHPAKKRKRGYNQAEVLAEELGRLLALPVRTDLVKRTKNTRAQKNLTPKQREKNLQQAFSGTGKRLHGEAVLLVDDIYTTGSTVDTLAVLLKELGAGKVYFAAVCLGNGD